MPKRKQKTFIPKIKFRNSKGQFTRFDKRKYLYDGRGTLVHAPHILENGKSGWTVEKYDIQSRTDFTLPTKTRRKFLPDLKILGYLDLYPPEFNLYFDLYDYLKIEGVQNMIDVYKLENSDWVITASVDVYIDGNLIKHIPQFKVTDFKANFIFSNKGRLGNEYTGTDAIAYYIHQTMNESDFLLYEYRTDIDIQVEDKNEKRSNRKKNKKENEFGKKIEYSNNIRIKITFKAISKALSREFPSVGQASENAKRAIKIKKRNK